MRSVEEGIDLLLRQLEVLGHRYLPRQRPELREKASACCVLLDLNEPCYHAPRSSDHHFVTCLYAREKSRQVRLRFAAVDPDSTRGTTVVLLAKLGQPLGEVICVSVRRRARVAASRARFSRMPAMSSQPACRGEGRVATGSRDDPAQF